MKMIVKIGLFNSSTGQSFVGKLIYIFSSRFSVLYVRKSISTVLHWTHFIYPLNYWHSLHDMHALGQLFITRYMYNKHCWR